MHAQIFYTFQNSRSSDTQSTSESDDESKILYNKFVKKCQRAYRMKQFAKPQCQGLYYVISIIFYKNKHYYDVTPMWLTSACFHNRIGLALNDQSVLTCFHLPSTSKSSACVKCKTTQKTNFMFPVHLHLFTVRLFQTLSFFRIFLKYLLHSLRGM